MKFCENMKLTCLKIIIIIIIGYTLNNFTPHIKTSWVDDGKIVISKIKNKFIFLKSNLKQGSLLQRSNNCQMLSTPWKFISVSLIQKREPYARDAKYPLKWALSSTGFACLFAHLFFLALHSSARNHATWFSMFFSSSKKTWRTFCCSSVPMFHITGCTALSGISASAQHVTLHKYFSHMWLFFINILMCRVTYWAAWVGMLL